MKATAVIAAGGSGSRLGDKTSKQFLPLAGTPLIVHTLRAFEKAESIDRIVVVLPDTERSRLDEATQKEFGLSKISAVVPGGATRQASVASGLEAIHWDPCCVAIHDAARCLITPELIDHAVAAIKGWDGIIMGLPVRDTLKRVQEEKIIVTESREALWGMQTPQVFRFPFIRKAYKKAKAEKFETTDDAAVAEWFGGKVGVTKGSTRNLKVTYPDDLALAEAILKGE